VTLVAGPLAAGWPAQAPYDLILIEGAVASIPAALGVQTRQESGRILGAICRDGRITQAVIAEATPAGLGLSPLFDCATAPLPSLRQAPAFAI
jgi:protein-L-isoaspartate(D-aspartate) O-methyltransferase